MSSYSNVQFLGYAIPTIPLIVGDVGDPNGPGFVEGRYIGIDPPAKDAEAVKKKLEKLPPDPHNKKK